jgi:hypothetical protein
MTSHHVSQCVWYSATEFSAALLHNTSGQDRELRVDRVPAITPDGQVVFHFQRLGVLGRAHDRG